MTTATLTTRRTVIPGQPTTRPGELALALQEAFTVVVRLRSGRQVAADAASFRTHIKQVVAAADRSARDAGYDAESVKLAVYAFIALLDESVLSSAQPMFADWSRQPLQEEVFGEHVAGENFFRTLDSLLAQQDSDGLADLLEVYLLCLLLGFHGRYGAGGADRVSSIGAAVRLRIERIRGSTPELAPGWRLPAAENVVAARDVVARRLAVAAAAAAGATLVMFLLYWFVLRLGLAELQSLI
jgi:type VI secretion system protein ImpK